MPTNKSSKAKKAAPLPLPPRRWQMIGVELEGSWNADPRRFLELSPLVDVKGDASIRGMDGHLREVTLGPYSELADLFPMVQQCYANKVNQTCGMHVHLSYEPAHAAKFACKEFYTHFKAFWERWGTKSQDANRTEPAWPLFWSRLAGRNTYCEPRVGLDHYCVINLGSYAEHGTIECRLLPMFHNPDNALRAIEAVTECFDSWLMPGVCPDYRKRKQIRINTYAAWPDRSEQRIGVRYLSERRTTSYQMTQLRAEEKLERYRAEQARQAPVTRYDDADDVQF